MTTPQTETIKARDTRYVVEALQQIAELAKNAECVIVDLKGEFDKLIRPLPCDQPIEDFDDKLLERLRDKLREAGRRAESNFGGANDLTLIASKLWDRMEYARKTLDGINMGDR